MREFVILRDEDGGLEMVTTDEDRLRGDLTENNLERYVA